MYAAKTTVSIEKTRMEIESMLTRFGASKMATFVEASQAVIVFDAKDRRLKFSLTADGQTVYEHVKAPIALSYKTGQMVPLLPWPNHRGPESN